ncbi:MAG: SGNH/GDSL hydrolase family protein [Methylococcaceae bacterium]|nr:SGNH/GDSL hydrolase family protein [Methylococcaceae bacterium]
MKRKFLLCQLLLIYILLPFQAIASNTPFSNIFVFGDSLSDNGNINSLSLPDLSFLNSPPFNHGFTNGPFAVEVLANNLNRDQNLHLTVNPSLHLVNRLPVGTNYAVAGARAGATGNPLFNLSSQVNTFLGSHSNSAPNDALYIIFIGSNDVLDALQTSDRRLITTAVEAIDNSLRELVYAGAESILVVNVSDLGLTPRVRALGTAVVKQATRLTNDFNSQLVRYVHKIEKERQIDIVDFDFFQLSHTVSENSVGLGYINTTEACLFNTNCVAQGKFDDFIYLDDIHPTADAQQRIGHALYTIVPELPE